MYVERVPNRKSRPAVLVRSSHWDRGKIRKVTHANLSKLPDQLVDDIALLLRGGVVVGPGSPAVQIVDSRPFGHIAALLSAACQLGLPKLLHTRPSRSRNLSLALVLLRVLRPAASLLTARKLAPGAEFAALGEALSLGPISEQDLDDTLDWLGRRQPAIEEKLARRHLGDGSLGFYALTSAAHAGYQRKPVPHSYLQEGKRGSLQIVVGLLCDANGHPVSTEVRTGHTADPATVAAQIDALRQRFGLRRVVLVGDHGMHAEARMRENLAPYENLGWISALPGLAVPRLLREWQFAPGQVGDSEVSRVESAAYPGERLLVCRNPRARRNGHERREALLEASEAALAGIRRSEGRNSTGLGGDALKRRADQALRQYGVRKHLLIKIKEDLLSWERNPASLASEAALDGLYVLRARVQPEDLDDAGVVRAYENLAAVERTFQHLNCVDLGLRSFSVPDSERGRAHALVCLLARYLELHLRQQLAPLLLKEEDGSSTERQAQHVAAGETLWDFRELLTDLGTLPRHRVRFQPNGESEHSEVLLLTDPSALQRRAFDLLRLRPSDYLPSGSTNARLSDETGTASTRGGSRSDP